MKCPSFLKLALVLSLACSLGLADPPRPSTAREVVATALVGCGMTLLAVSLVLGIGGVYISGWPAKGTPADIERGASMVKLGALGDVVGAGMVVSGFVVGTDLLGDGSTPTIVSITGVPDGTDVSINSTDGSIEKVEGTAYPKPGATSMPVRDFAFSLDVPAGLEIEVAVSFSVFGITRTGKILVKGGQENDFSFEDAIRASEFSGVSESNG